MDYVPVSLKPKICSKGYHLMMENDLRVEGNRVQIQTSVKLIGVGLLVLFLMSLVSQLIMQLNYQSLRQQLEQDLQTIEDRLQYTKQFTALQNQAYGQNNDNDPSRSIRSGNSGIITNPNFYTTGKGVSGKYFLWDDFANTNFEIDGRVGDGVKKIRFLRSGRYYIFARVAIHGRSSNTMGYLPYLGIALYKQKKGFQQDEPLVRSFITQDDRGRQYRSTNPNYPKYPLDSVYVSGIFHIHNRDRVYVTKLESMGGDPNGEQYLVNQEMAQFGAFRIEEDATTVQPQRHY